LLFNLSNACLRNDALPGCAMSVHDQNEFRKFNFKFILHEHVVCFKLIVFEFITSCMILMLFINVLDSNMFMYSNVTCRYKKKKHVEAKNAIFRAWQC